MVNSELNRVLGAGRLVSLCIALVFALSLHAVEYTDEQRQALWQQPDFVQVSLAVAEPGDVLYSVYGHACLHLTCAAYDLDRYFTNEGENVNAKIVQFFCGRLMMGVKSFYPDDYLNQYREEGRCVVEYRLNLPIEVKRNLWKILDEHLEKGDCSPYDYYRHGCALSCVQWINEALNETYGKDVHIHYTAWPEHFNRTPREIGGAAAAISPWTQYIIYFIVGNEMDRPVRKEYKLILPADLAYAWQQATVNGDTLLSSEAHVLVDATHTSHATHVTPTMVACLMVVLALLTFFVPKPWAFGIDSIIIGIQTLLGCFMTYLVGFSDLCCTDWNWLLIAFNPLPLFLLLSLRKNARHRLLGWFAFGLAVVNIVWCVVMLCVPRTIVIAPHILQTLACSICMMHLATAWAKVVVAPHLTKVSNQSPS